MAGYIYTKINWENEPSYNTPINETNLNHMDQGIFDLAYVKAEKEDAVFVNSISLDRKAGTSVGLDSVAAGYDTEASGVSSVAIGSNTSAKNGQAVAGGFNSKAWGNTSLAFGTNCITRLNAAESQAIGNNCIAGSANQMVFGQYNVEDTTGTYAEIVGNGSSGNESNARTLDWQGNETIAGDFTNGNGETLHGIYEALPVDTESGNPAVITDAFGGACKSLKLTLEPIQSGSGTPSPQNVRPISGRTQSVIYRYGKNLFNASAIVRRYVSDPQTRLETGSIVKVTLGDKLVFSTDYSGIQFGIIFFDDAAKTTNIEDSGWLNPNTTYTVRHDGFICLGSIGIRNSDNSAFSDADIANIKNAHTQLEIGSTATPYEPYNGTSITRTYGQTVYGGSDDVISGVLTVEKYYFKIDNNTSIDQQGTSTPNVYRFGIIPPLSAKEPPTAQENGGVISNIVESGSAGDTYSAQNSISIRNGRIIVYLDNMAQLSASDAKQYMINNNMEIVYPLDTPITVQLTPEEVTLLKGDNVLTTDADSVEASYSADIALYITKKIAEGSQNNRSLSKGGSGDEESKDEEKEEEKKEEIEIKEAEPLTKEVR